MQAKDPRECETNGKTPDERSIGRGRAELPWPICLPGSFHSSGKFDGRALSYAMRDDWMPSTLHAASGRLITGIELLCQHQKCVAETVGRFVGFVAKYMGDGVLEQIPLGL
jgi:hypothetical protein